MSHQYEVAAEYILRSVGKNPEVGIICGSGLSGLSKVIQDPITVAYDDIPGFPKATVAGHVGELVFGTMNGVSVVCLRGRFHFYEGNNMQTVALPVRVMRLIGVKLLVVTNAAGGLNPDYEVGDIAVIQDHFGGPIIAGNSPLIGANDDALGPRFPSTSDTYDEVLQNKVLQCASDLKLSSYMRANATYCFVSGPSYESRAECRFLRSVGGDSVGMSTVPEIIAAKHVGMQILCLSMITNKVIIERRANSIHASHEEVLQSVKTAGDRMMKLVHAFVHEKVIGKYLKSLPEPKVYQSRRAFPSDKESANKNPESGLYGNVHLPTLFAAGILSVAMIWMRESFRGT